jgi:carbamoyltransferase
MYKEFKKIGWTKSDHRIILFPEHHLSHAASAFFPSPFDEAAIITIDGVGEWATASICIGRGNQIKILKELRFPHSIGLLYSSFTYYLGFRVNSGEYKLMGLAPFGNPEDEQTQVYINQIKSKLINVSDDGSIKLNMDLFSFATSLRMLKGEKWGKLFGFKRRAEDDPIQQHHCNLAYAIQFVTEQLFFRIAQTAYKLSDGVENLCLAGGVALNCVANGKLLKNGPFRNIFIQPAAGDAGGALGSALAAWHIYYGKERAAVKHDRMKGTYLGPDYPRSSIIRLLNKYKAVAEEVDQEYELCKMVAKLIGNGSVVGWFQGRMEFGPRALGNRSILGDPRNLEMQKKLNLKIKHREGFRPFAPAVNIEWVSEYFENGFISPYMLLIDYVKEERRQKLPDSYYDLPLMEMLYKQRSDIQAVTHVDFTARVQTVHSDTNPRFHSLIRSFREHTGCGLLVNTSFNVRGEPIVCTPEDAYKCFMKTEMDYLVIGDFVFEKEKQPTWKADMEWEKQLKKD